ncbi:hypothetical protein FAES_3413 [Fibrella aestuarina BUZ 2]|uniref:Uncharacterized protein n=1 Tax=Fibrella aestuarina BUZ 2 TaxID=1166018 RepID=I0KBB8_9BACT|nr:hypothetical protein FAES_3413 [Fibrella aestuarina BUZ 2]
MTPIGRAETGYPGACSLRYTRKKAALSSAGSGCWVVLFPFYYNTATFGYIRLLTASDFCPNKKRKQ